MGKSCISSTLSKTNAKLFGFMSTSIKMKLEKKETQKSFGQYIFAFALALY